MRGALGRLHRLRAGLARATCALGALLSAPDVCHAQSTVEALLRTDAGLDHARARVTMDPAFMLGLGYVRTVSLDDTGSRQLGLHADLEALIDLSSWNLTTGASTRLFDRPGFDVLGAIDLELALAQNEVHTALAYGYRMTVLPGYFRPKWFAAAEIGVRGNLATTLWQKGAYTTEVPDAANGTYWTGTTYLYLGARVGFRMFERYFAGLRAAYRMPTTFESYGPWVQPMTMSVELGGTFDAF